ncbi:hypothetical protein D1007_44175 [Hordeum vulgare]|nr:hypothetical protein D1007_44175 [Hordeum vulgare]
MRQIACTGHRRSRRRPPTTTGSRRPRGPDARSTARTTASLPCLAHEAAAPDPELPTQTQGNQGPAATILGTLGLPGGCLTRRRGREGEGVGRLGLGGRGGGNGGGVSPAVCPRIFWVHITVDELECLISNSSALEHLTLKYCYTITYLKIPSLLQHLSYLTVAACPNLQTIECKAPNLSTFYFSGRQVELLFGDSVQVKTMRLRCFAQCFYLEKEASPRPCFAQCNTIYNACANLPSIVPNIETLNISSVSEVVNTPIVPVKFLRLKYLSMSLEGNGAFSPDYDYFSLVSLLDACPVLETFNLVVSQDRMKHNSVLGDPSSRLRQMPEYQHDNIKNVKITGFCSAKSMVELACHILENATSLECLTLDTICVAFSFDRHIHKIGECQAIGRHMIREARKALLAVKRYIVGIVPSTVKLNVLEPCKLCHTLAA